MKKSDFYYELPKELIAQHPAEPRNASRLLVMDRETGALTHDHFYHLGNYLKAGDCLILNDTRVLPARLFGRRKDSGASVEFLLLKQMQGACWEAIAGPGKKARQGHCFTFGPELEMQVKDVLDNGNRIVEFFYSGNFYEILDRIGQMPLPHYITQPLEDNEQYQTVYARQQGSAAAPTAGLHFTKQMLSELEAKGIGVGYVTLHVGLGTFRPVKAERIEDHHMHAEHYSIPAQTAALIAQTRQKGGRVICVGTTSCRTLESAAQNGPLKACESDTGIFIYPGYRFRCMDGLITNFHLPESTLIMLVSAFAGHAHTMRAYQAAVMERYRFFSFGDAMFII